MGSQLASSSRHTITGIHLSCRWWAAVSLDAVLLLRRALRGPRMPSETNARLQKSLFCAPGIEGSPLGMKKRQMGISRGRRLSRDVL